MICWWCVCLCVFPQWMILISLLNAIGIRYPVSGDCNKKNCFYSLEIFPFQKHFRLPNIDTLQYSREKKIKWQNEWNARFKLTICIHLRFLLVKCKCIRCNFRGLILEIFFFLSRVFLSIEIIYIFPIETFI